MCCFAAIASSVSPEITFAKDKPQGIPESLRLHMDSPPQFDVAMSLAITSDVPSGFTLYDLRASQNMWVALFTHPHSDDPKNVAVDIETYALDPVSGKAVARYVYPGFMGFGLACSDGVDFTVLERPSDKLELVKLVPAHASSSEKTKEK